MGAVKDRVIDVVKLMEANKSAQAVEVLRDFFYPTETDERLEKMARAILEDDQDEIFNLQELS